MLTTSLHSLCPLPWLRAPRNLIETLDVIDGYDRIAGDIVEKLLQDSRRQITGAAAVGRQACAVRDVIDRVEVAHCPLI